MVWVDVGGGTARNLEFFALHTLRRFFRQIYIVDVSRSLLEVGGEGCFVVVSSTYVSGQGVSSIGGYLPLVDMLNAFIRVANR